jgi:integrase
MRRTLASLMPAAAAMVRVLQCVALAGFCRSAATASGWREASFELFRDVVIAVRETGMRNQRELYRMRVENIDWTNKVIFVPDSKTLDGRRLVPMSDRVERILRRQAGRLGVRR